MGPGMPFETVGRDEFIWLRQRVDSIDATGTRGEVVLATQVKQVIGDIAQLRNELVGHRAEHVKAERSRVVGRRWLIGVVIAVLAAIDGPIVTVLLSIAHR